MPNVARIYDYYLGGRENFQVDRTAAEELARIAPGANDAARDNRAFMHRVVRFLADQGISQFLDIGSGMPGMPGMPGATSVLDVARRVNPDARVAYVDYDPVVVSHGLALLAKPDQAIMVRADLRDPEMLVGHPSIRGHLDFRQPIGVLLLAVMHFVSDHDDPAGITAILRDALAPGSYLAIGHVTRDHLPRAMVSSGIAMFARTSASIWPRTMSHIRRLFDGLDLVDPGLVPLHIWRPDLDEPPAREITFLLGGVARKHSSLDVE